MLDLSVRHMSTPDQCPRCHPLPEGFDARQEAIWQHAVNQFVDQSRADVTGMSRADLAPLVRSWAAANAVARMDRALLVAPSRSGRLRYEPRSYRFALFLIFATLTCLAVVCAGVWRFFA